jgi:hypothetical protein
MTPIFSSALLRAQSDERLLRLVREGPARSSGDGEHQTALPEGQRRDQPQADQPAPPEGGDSKPAGDQGDPPPPPDSGSGDNGD